MRRIVLALLGVALMAACFGGPALAKRVALVIGNEAYANLPALQKSVNDARAVAAALEEIGFKVLLGTDLTRRETNRKLADFEAEIAPGDKAFFFFAGHGVALHRLRRPRLPSRPRRGSTTRRSGACRSTSACRG